LDLKILLTPPTPVGYLFDALPINTSESIQQKMGFKVTTLWKAPEINPVNGKARSIPILNPFNKHGRVFHFAWFGFMIAFLAW